MAGSSGEPHPVSDIPVRGGVKIEGSSFSCKIPVSNEGKGGVYYVTVWASLGKNTKPIPISRRVIVGNLALAGANASESVSGQVDGTSDTQQPTQTDKHKHKKKKSPNSQDQT
jgi:hypothetical protein